MTHLWVRAEQRENEDRVGITPEGAKALIEAGYQVTVEDSENRAGHLREGRVSGARGARLSVRPPLGVPLEKNVLLSAASAWAADLERHEQQYLRPSNRSERSQRFPAASAAAAPCRRRSPRSREVA